MSDLPKDGLPSAEDLDKFAEEQALANATAKAREFVDATVTNVNESLGTCTTCGLPSLRICTHCGQEFCASHFCITHEMSTERVPIVDEDGTEHRGQRVRLIGEGWPNHLLLIKDLSDDELDARIKELQGFLTQAIRTQDYTQISLAAHEYEKGYRQHSRYVAAIKRREKIQQGSVRLNNKRHRVDASGAKTSIPADIAALMKLGNLTYEKAVEMKSILSGKMKA
jgi:hypothetical protein